MQVESRPCTRVPLQTLETREYIPNPGQFEGRTARSEAKCACVVHTLFRIL